MRTLLRTPKGTHEGYAEGTQKSVRTGTQMGYANAKKVRTPCGRIVHIHQSANMTTFFAFDLAEWVTCFTVRADPVIRSSHLNSTIFRLNPHGYRWSAGSNSIVFDECQNNSANYIQGTNDRTSSTENSCLNVYGRTFSCKPLPEKILTVFYHPSHMN